MLRTVAAIILAMTLAGCVSLDTVPKTIPFTVRSSAAAGFTATARSFGP